jgi:hypothetical protein
MKLPSSITELLRVGSLLALSACIKTDCVTVPCLLPQAVTVTVSNAASGGAVPNAVVQITGALSGTAPCNGTPTTCHINGYAGTYSLAVSAPGFQSATRDVTVVGVERTDECHCPAVETAQVSVTLTPSYTQR